MQRSSVVAPAIGLMVVSGLSIAVLAVSFAFSAWLLASGVADALPPRGGVSRDTQIAIRMGFEALMVVSHVVTIAGALGMRSRRGYGLAKLGAVLACVPCLSPCIALGIPFGVWALVVLARPEVRDAFAD